MNSRWTKEKKSFRAAGYGLWCFFKFEPHALIHLLAIVVVMATAFIVKCTATEWCLLLLSFGLVIGAEMLNTAVEKLADMVQPQKDDRIRFVKDVAAGAVLFAAAMSVGIALLILLPKLVH